MRRIAAAVVLAALASAGCGNQAAHAPPGVRAGLGALVHGGAPGAVLFVRHGPESYTIAAGVSDTAHRTPMRTGDTFRIGSITKSYTAALVMRLVAQGRIALDDPVSRYRPGLVPNGGHISIGELLSHTSGLYNYTDDPAFVAPYLAGDLHHSWRPRELVALATAHPPLFAPGARYSYSNTNFVLLGLVLEEVTGATYGRQLRDHILRPLGLGSTSLPTDNGSPPTARGYYSAGGASPPEDVTQLVSSFAWSAGAIVATGEDVADFYRALLAGRLVPQLQLDRMEDASGTNGRYGLGLVPALLSCGPAYGHNGNYPGYFVLAAGSDDGARQVVLLVNADPTMLSEAAVREMSQLFDDAFCG